MPIARPRKTRVMCQRGTTPEMEAMERKLHPSNLEGRCVLEDGQWLPQQVRFPESKQWKEILKPLHFMPQT